MPKTSAIAYPIQGLVKYHGLKDPVRRIPFHDSISVCTGPIHTQTTFAWTDEDKSTARIDGQDISGRPMQRIHAVVDALRERTDEDRHWRMESRNDFPQYVGLGSSSSGFAALAVAASHSLGLDLDLEHISEFARLGAGSASRAVTGGVSEWVTDGGRSFSRRILDEDAVDWRIVVPLVEHEEPTEGVHAEVLTSPLFQARCDYIPSAIDAMRAGCDAKDLAQIGQIAERDTLNLHAITMTADSGHVTWQPATMAVMRTVRRLRTEGVPVWFSIDTGATAYLNTDEAHEDQVAEAVAGIDGVARVLHLAPAGPAHIVDDHL